MGLRLFIWNTKEGIGTKKRYTITLEDDDEVFVTKPTRELIYESMPKGKTTISSKVATTFKIGRRKALEHLTNLEEVGLLKSEMGVIKYKSGAKARARIFKRI